MDFNIAGKVAFVSGGSKGVGRRLSEMLGKEGCKVVVAARGQEAIDETVAAIEAAGGRAMGVSVDLTKEADVARALAACRETFGPPDISVNNVHGPGPGDLMDVTPEDFVACFQQIALSAIFLARQVIPHMKEQRWGRIISIGSGAAKEPPPELKHILANTVRASVVSFNKSISNELAPFGITVNTIATGWIGSERMYGYLDTLAQERGVSRDQVVADMGRNIPAGRPGKPEEMAALIAFLCSDQAAYITGTLIPVDGGVHRSAW